MITVWCWWSGYCHKMWHTNVCVPYINIKIKCNNQMQWREYCRWEKCQYNRVGTFHNVLHSLQWVANKLVFFTCHSSIFYYVLNLIGSVLQTTRWMDKCLSLKLNHSLFFYWTSTSIVVSLNFASVCVVIWCKMEYNIYFSNNGKRKKKKGNDKNRFQEKIIQLLCCVLYNTYNEPSSLFSCNGSCAFILVGVTKKKKTT